MPYVPIPRSDFNPEAGTAILRERVSRQTSIVGYTAAATNVLLGRGGLLMISEGFVWDYASGPAIDTPDMVHGSLIHDALYLLMRTGQLPWTERKRADSLFRDMLLEAGCPPFRAWYAYRAVRLFGKMYRGKQEAARERYV